MHSAVTISSIGGDKETPVLKDNLNIKKILYLILGLIIQMMSFVLYAWLATILLLAVSSASGLEGLAALIIAVPVGYILSVLTTMGFVIKKADRLYQVGSNKMNLSILFVFYFTFLPLLLLFANFIVWLFTGKYLGDY